MILFLFLKKCSIFASQFGDNSIGEMVEWSITAVLKTAVPRGTGGSNPSLSAKLKHRVKTRCFFIPIRSMLACLILSVLSVGLGPYLGSKLSK